MMVELLFPPTWNAFGPPHLALPLLKGYLQRDGIPVVIRDVNHMVLRDFFTRPYLERVQVELRHRLQVCRSVGGEDSELFRELLVADDLASFVLSVMGSDGDSATLPAGRRPGLFDLAARAISALSFPTSWSIRDGSYNHPTTSRAPTLENALAMARKDHANVFARYFRNTLAGRLTKDPRHVTGISVVRDQQLIPALTLARIVRELTPEACIVLGGSAVPWIWPALAGCPDFFSLVDAVVTGPGEIPLREIVRRYSDGASLKSIPNTMVREPDGVVHGACATLDPVLVTEDYTPDFHDIPLRDYLLSEPFLTLMATTRCYWNKCTFCSRGTALNVPYRPRTAAHLASQMRSLHSEYGVSHVDLIDDCVPIPLAKQIAAELLQGDVSLTWQFACRFDCEVADPEARDLYRSGCRLIRWGLESGCQSVLDRMQKGTQCDRIARMLRATHTAGIWNHVFLIVGFPGESDEEFESTMDFLRANVQHIDSLGASVFAAEKFSDVADHPWKYQLTLADTEYGRTYVKGVSIVSGGVPSLQLASRMQALERFMADTHLGALDALPLYDLLSVLIRTPKEQVRAMQQEVAAARRESLANVASATASRLGELAWVGPAHTLKMGNGHASLCTVAVADSDRVFQIEESIADRLRTPAGIPAEEVLCGDMWRLSERASGLPKGALAEALAEVGALIALQRSVSRISQRSPGNPAPSHVTC